MDSRADYVPPPIACETLATAVARFDGTWLSRAPLAETDIGVPDGVDADVRELWQRRGRPTAELQEGVARIDRGRVFGDGIVVTPDGQSVVRDVSLDFGRAEEGHWLVGDEKIRAPEWVPGVTTVVASALGEGYCHWLLDELPRLLSLPREARGSTLIAHAQLECSRTALELLGWTGALLQPKRRAYRQCEQLLVPLLPGWTGRATRRQLELVVEFAARLPVVAPQLKGERLFVSRAGARRRRITNEAEVVAALAPMGFEAVRLEELSWAEQVACFRRAKVIVAPHGAGLANLAFCAPGTRVVEGLNRSHVNDCFWQIAALRGLEYRALLAVGTEPLACDPKANRLDFALDVPRLLAVVR
jgi:capsular polysaccharide biosynthesis protein